MSLVQVSSTVVSDWLECAAKLSPLLQFAATDCWGGESTILARIFSAIDRGAGFGVEFGQRSLAGGTLTDTVAALEWSALYMDRHPATPEESRARSNGPTLTLARESVTPATITDLFHKYEVPKNLDCLVIDIDGLDYWVWEAIAESYAPSLVVVEFNAHVPLRMKATIAPDPDWTYRSDKNYGASFSALCELGIRKGYRLIHVHGPWNLYFLRNDIPFAPELCITDSLDEADFSLLTDTAAFYDTLCSGKRPSWFGAPDPDLSLAPWRLLAPDTPTQSIDLEGVHISVLRTPTDPAWYQQRQTFEEKASLIYRLIDEARFDNFIDVGANVGLVSVFAKRACERMRLIAVEADPRLAELARRNFQANGVKDATVVNAVLGAVERPSVGFSLNPSSSLDNRVRMPGWEQIRVPALAGAPLLTRLQVEGRTFIKIDTQGFELDVMTGLESWLLERDDWLIKMEFAPHWLQSQGTDPSQLLDYLQLRYEFSEFPARIPFGTRGLSTLMQQPIRYRQHRDFIEHVVSLNKGSMGWVDLLVWPRQDG